MISVKIEAASISELKTRLTEYLDQLGMEQKTAAAQPSAAPVDVPTAEPVETSTPEPVVEDTSASETNGSGAPTREDVSNKIKEFVQKRGRTGIAGILSVHDAKRLTDLKEENYGDVIAAIDANLAKAENEAVA